MTEISLDPPPNCRYILFSCLDEFLKWFLVLNFIVKAITLLFRALACLPTMPCYTRKLFFFQNSLACCCFFTLWKYGLMWSYFDSKNGFMPYEFLWHVRRLCVSGIINFSFSGIFPYTLNEWCLLWYNESTREKIIMYFKLFFRWAINPALLIHFNHTVLLRWSVSA